MGRLAVETGAFPLYEVENGKYRLSADMPETLRPLEDYTNLQGRFRHLTPGDIEYFQERVKLEYKKLMIKVKSFR